MPIGIGLASLIGSGISAGTGLINSLLQKKVAQKNTDQTISENKKLAEYQYSKNLESWNKQNEYNTPENQMKRFESAGLNPNLIYDKGTSGVASAISPYQAPTVKKDYKPIEVPQMTSIWQNFAMRQAQTDNLRAKNDLLQTEKEMKYLNWQDLKNTYGLKWGNTKFDLPEVAGSNEQKRFLQELEKTQTQIKSEKQRQKLNQFSIDLFDNGGKYFTPFLQLLQLLRK